MTTATEALIIDGDSHVLEPPHLWEEYLEREFRPRAIRIVQSVAGPDGGGARPGAHAPETEEPLPEMAEDVRQRLGAGEALIIDRQIVLTGSLAGTGGVEQHRGKLEYMK